MFSFSDQECNTYGYDDIRHISNLREDLQFCNGVLVSIDVFKSLGSVFFNPIKNADD